MRHGNLIGAFHDLQEELAVPRVGLEGELGTTACIISLEPPPECTPMLSDGIPSTADTSSPDLIIRQQYS
jgi:hypothetical protein